MSLPLVHPIPAKYSCIAHYEAGVYEGLILTKLKLAGWWLCYNWDSPVWQLEVHVIIILISTHSPFASGT
jgi:hypothetical protein